MALEGEFALRAPLLRLKLLPGQIQAQAQAQAQVQLRVRVRVQAQRVHRSAGRRRWPAH